MIEGWFPPKKPWEMELSGPDLLMLGIDTILYMCLVFLLEYLRSKQISFTKLFAKYPFLSLHTLITSYREKSIKYEEKIWDDDVTVENMKISKSGDSEYALKVKEIRKVFMLGSNRHKVAVDKISFGVEQGEVFALLGVNGAGKTTTFKMMSGEIAPTEGSVTIKGFDMSKEMSQAQKFIGYCPQFDALLDNLTAREHLQLYAAIKGIPNHKVYLSVFYSRPNPLLIY